MNSVILSPMRFKNFVWPHNPRVYSITFERKMAVHKIPFGRHRLQSLGQTRRVLKGQGEFAGEGAYDTFKKLASVFYEETPGVLVHPVWMCPGSGDIYCHSDPQWIEQCGFFK